MAWYSHREAGESHTPGEGTDTLGRKQRTSEDYKAILNAYRELGPNHSAVSRALKIDRLTARRAFEQGWPDLLKKSYGNSGHPIQKMLEGESIAARAARVDQALGTLDNLSTQEKGILALERKAQETFEAAQKKLAEVEALAEQKVAGAEAAASARMASAEIEAKKRLADLLAKAKVDAAETLADEAAGSKFGRKAALGAVAVAALVLRDAQVLAESLKATPDELRKLPPANRIRYAYALMKLVESAEKALILSLQAERIRMGQPTETIGIATIDQSFAEREIKLKALQRAHERAKLKLVNGGLAPAATGTDERQGTAVVGGGGGVAGGHTPVH